MNDAIVDGIKLFIALISILNPLGALPTFLSLTKNYSKKKLKKTSTHCSIAVMITLIVGLFFGLHILNFFSIGLPSFRVGGGLLIGMMALNMLNAQRPHSKLTESELDIESSDQESDVGIVPLAIPLLAGPGAISTSIIHGQNLKGPADWLVSILVCISMGVIIKLVLGSARPIGRKLGTVGVNVMTRIMGLIIMAIAIEFVTGGLKQIFPFLNS